MFDRAVKRKAPLFEKLQGFLQCSAARAQADSGCADNLFLRRLLAVLSGEIDSQDGIAHTQKELCVWPGDAPLLLHDRIALIPSSRARRHVLLAFAPELRADIVRRAPTDPVVHIQAKNVYVKVLRPLQIVTLDGGMIDSYNLAVFGLGIGDNQLDTISI